MSESSGIVVASARDLGPQFVNNRERIVGLDGAFSIPLPGGKALWFFGDTLIGERPAGSLWYVDGEPVGPSDMSGRGTIERMINNTGAIVRDRSLISYDFILDSSGNVKALIPLEGDEHPDRDRIWCQHGIYHDGQLYLSFIKVRMTPAGTCPFPVCFEIVGSGLAAGRAREWDFRRITRGGDSVLWHADEPHFATAIVRHDDHFYLYGTRKHNEVQECFVARTRSIEAVDEYQYFPAQPIFEGMPSELSVSYNAHLRKFLAVHSLYLTGQIVGRTAKDPIGPWSQPAVLWDASPNHPDPAKYPKLIYAGKEHPELSEEGGRVIYLTYVEFEEYFPRLIEVTLEGS